MDAVQYYSTFFPETSFPSVKLRVVCGIGLLGDYPQWLFYPLSKYIPLKPIYTYIQKFKMMITGW